jgi:hypothetical protein
MGALEGPPGKILSCLMRSAKQEYFSQENGQHDKDGEGTVQVYSELFPSLSLHSPFDLDRFTKFLIRHTAHNEEFHNLYSSPSIIRMIKSRRMRWAGHIARMGEKRNAYRILRRNPEGKRPLARPRRR